jgi:hypothetical protein
MIAMNLSSEQVCRELMDAFFMKYPDRRIQGTARRALAGLVARGIPMAGKPGGWAGGIVYAVGSHGCGVPNFLNRELEEAFGTTMNTIYRRAARVRDVLDL